MAPPGVTVENLALRYAGASVFENLSLQVAPGQFVVLLGPSGVGKSSLLRVIAGLEMPAAGSVRATDGEKLAGRVAYMGQQDLLFPWARVLDNVMLGSRLRGEISDQARARDLLARVGLEGREGALPAELSGGMRQRAALARTLYERRPIVLMD
jgi:putative hydroxymethylpyrimidine transport system ATP-binding protein